MLIYNILAFLLGLIFLVKGSDYFVKSASSIAKKLGVSEFIIGLTLVAIGTSLPELFSSVAASIRGESGIVIGTVIGANVANLTLIAGIGALIYTIKIKREVLKRDGYMLLFSTLLLGIFLLNKTLSRIEGGIFLLIFFVYIIYLLKANNEKNKHNYFREFVPYFLKLGYLKEIKNKLFGKKEKYMSGKTPIKKFNKKDLFYDFLILILSGIMIAFGAKYFVSEAVNLAHLFLLPTIFIGIIMAIGTTIPELSVAISASRKGRGDIILGNVLGSCITNTFLILGISSLINPIRILNITLIYFVPFLILIAILFLVFIKTNWKLKKIEGGALIISYFLFLFLIFKIIF